MRDILGMDAKKPLSEEYRQQARQYIRDFAKRTGVGPKRLAKRTGIPVTEVKKALDRRSPVNPDETLKALLKAINLMPKSSGKKRPPHEVAGIRLLHDIHARVVMGIELCREGDPEMVMIIGPAGCGKSMCLQGIAQYYPDSVYMCITEATARTLPFLRELAHRLGIVVECKTIADAFRAIENTLKHTYRLLIIDEMHLSDTRLLNAVRELMDTTHCPIVLAGQPRLRDNVFKGRHDRSRGATIYRRIGPVLDVCNVTALAQPPEPGNGDKPVRDREMIHSRADVCKVLESRRLKIRIDPGAMATLVYVANVADAGMLGLAIGAVRHALIANPGMTILTDALLREALQTRNTIDEFKHLESLMESDPLARRIRQRYAKTT